MEGQFFNTNNYGIVEVVQYINTNNIVVKFKDGNTKIVTKNNLLKGKVRNSAPSIDNSYNIRIGSVFPTTKSGDIKVLSWKNSAEVTIEFLTTKETKIVTAQSISIGKVKNKNYYFVKNGGIVTSGKFKPSGCVYRSWLGILARANSESYKNSFPTYANVSVCSDWLFFQNFAEWFHTTINSDKQGWHLDKDILVKNNKIYSKDFCCFVPPEINGLFTKCNAARGELPIGVSFCTTKQKYLSSVNFEGKNKFLGYFDDSTSAFLKYKQEKEKIIKYMAKKYENDLPLNVLNSLINYQVDIED